MTILYAALDASGNPFQISPYAPFVTYWMNGKLDTVSHPGNALGLFTPADLTTFGVTSLTVTEPSGEQISGVTLSVSAGVITITPTYSPIPPPQVVSRMQLKQALNQMGLLAQVETYVSSADAQLQIYWSDTSDFHRDHPTLVAALTAMGMTSAQADQVFTLAANQT